MFLFKTGDHFNRPLFRLCQHRRDRVLGTLPRPISIPRKFHEFGITLLLTHFLSDYLYLRRRCRLRCVSKIPAKKSWKNATKRPRTGVFSWWCLLGTGISALPTRMLLLRLFSAHATTNEQSFSLTQWKLSRLREKKNSDAIFSICHCSLFLFFLVILW